MSQMIGLYRVYEMEVSHYLTDGVPERHKCRRVHGHRYVMEIELEGTPGEDGMLVEYGAIDATVKPIVALVDHYDLNTLDQRCSTPEAAAVAKNPTVELLLVWFLTRLGLLASVRPATVSRLSSIQIGEDSRTGVRWPPRR